MPFSSFSGVLMCACLLPAFSFLRCSPHLHGSRFPRLLRKVHGVQTVGLREEPSSLSLRVLKPQAHKPQPFFGRTLRTPHMYSPKIPYNYTHQSSSYFTWSPYPKQYTLGSKHPNNRALGPKYHNITGLSPKTISFGSLDPLG